MTRATTPPATETRSTAAKRAARDVMRRYVAAKRNDGARDVIKDTAHGAKSMARVAKVQDDAGWRAYYAEQARLLRIALRALRAAVRS